MSSRGRTLKQSPVVVIGIDGADPRLMKNWAERGDLVNIGELAGQGAGIGQLESSPNAMSPSAWTSFRTGLSPGRHGVFNFLDKAPGHYRIRHSTNRLVQLESFWKYAGDCGKRVAVLYVPINYPVEAVNGIQIAGWLTPSLRAEGSVFPDTLLSEITRKVPEFEIHWPFKELIQAGRYRDALDHKLQSIRAKIRVARHLLESDNYDLVILVFEELDHLQHFYWHFMDPGHPRHVGSAEARLKEAIFAGYVEVDRAIGELRQVYGIDAHYLIISDHGFRANTYGHLYIADLLRKTGYQCERRSFLKEFARYAYDIAECLPTKVKYKLAGMIPKLREGVLESRSFSNIEWERTRAYSIYLNRISDIWINVSGRDPQGIVPAEGYEEVCAELTDMLLDCRELKSGERPIRTVLKKEDIYDGRYRDGAADLIVKWREDVFVNGLVVEGPRKVVADRPVERDIRTGDHADYGVLVDNRGTLLTAGTGPVGIVDLPRYVLSSLALPVPRRMESGIDASHEEKDRAERSDDCSGAPNVSARSCEEEARLIEERLRDVGYM